MLSGIIRGMSLLEKYAHFLFRRKYWILSLTVFISIFFAWYAARVKIINALENMLPEHDPELVKFQQFNKDYDGDFILMIAIEADEIFTIPMLETIQSITNEFDKLPHVDQLYSLTNVEELTSENDELQFRKLIPEIPTNPEDLARLKEKITSDPLYTRYLVHPTKPICTFFLKLKHYDSIQKKQETRDLLVPAVKKILNKHQEKINFTYRLAGNLALEHELDLSSKKTQVYSSISIMIMMSVLLYLLFRHKSGILLLMVNIGLAALWTMGFIGLTGRSLNFITTILPSLILIVAVLDCIHLYAIYLCQDTTLPAQDRMKKTIQDVFLPCFFTSLTTMIGFGCLGFSDMEVTRNFGLFAAFGIFVAFVLTMGPYCILITMLTEKQKKITHTISPLLNKAVSCIVFFNRRYWKWTILFASVLTVFFALGFTRLVVEDRPVTHYPKGHPVREAFEFFDENFNGSTTIDFIVSGKPDSMKDPDNLRMIDHFIQTYSNTQNVSAPLSIIEYLKKANQALHNNDKKYYKIPEEKKVISQLFFLLEGDDAFNAMVLSDYSSLRIHSRIRALGSRVGRVVYNNVLAVIDSTIHAPLTAIGTGSNVVWMNMGEHITNSLIKSFTGSVCIVTLIMILLVRSIKWGLVSMIPNLVPIVFTFGLMGWLNITLNMVTLMIASIAIGIAVDDTIHLMVHLRRNMAKGHDMNESLELTFQEVGVAVISTSVILSLGFFTLYFSDFIPTKYFGLFTGLTVIFALLCDLILLPACLKLFQRWLVPKKRSHITSESNLLIVEI